MILSLWFSCVCITAIYGDTLRLREWMVDGIKREALVYIPGAANSKDVPLVFVWHGHGGTMRHSARTFDIHNKWPEVIVVYPQGLPAPGVKTDPEGKRPGWQQRHGMQGDRDIRFFDAMLKTLKEEYPVDVRNIFCTGYSNGGMMTFLLWSVYPGTFRAFAPMACVSLPAVPLSVPKPAFFLMGTEDELVNPELMRMTIKRLKRLNMNAEQGTPWTQEAMLYTSPVGAPLIVLTHPGRHQIPPGGKTEELVRFFREQLVE